MKIKKRLFILLFLSVLSFPLPSLFSMEGSSLSVKSVLSAADALFRFTLSQPGDLSEDTLVSMFSRAIKDGNISRLNLLLTKCFEFLSLESSARIYLMVQEKALEEARLQEGEEEGESGAASASVVPVNRFEEYAGCIRNELSVTGLLKDFIGHAFCTNAKLYKDFLLDDFADRLTQIIDRDELTQALELAIEHGNEGFFSSVISLFSSLVDDEFILSVVKRGVRECRLRSDVSSRLLKQIALRAYSCVKKAGNDELAAEVKRQFVVGRSNDPKLLEKLFMNCIKSQEDYAVDLSIVALIVEHFSAEIGRMAAGNGLVWAVAGGKYELIECIARGLKDKISGVIAVRAFITVCKRITGGVGVEKNSLCKVAMERHLSEKFTQDSIKKFLLMLVNSPRDTSKLLAECQRQFGDKIGSIGFLTYFVAAANKKKPDLARFVYETFQLGKHPTRHVGAALLSPEVVNDPSLIAAVFGRSANEVLEVDDDLSLSIPMDNEVAGFARFICLDKKMPDPYKGVLRKFILDPYLEVCSNANHLLTCRALELAAASDRSDIVDEIWRRYEDEVACKRDIKHFGGGPVLPYVVALEKGHHRCARQIKHRFAQPLLDPFFVNVEFLRIVSTGSLSLLEALLSDQDLVSKVSVERVIETYFDLLDKEEFLKAKRIAEVFHNVMCSDGRMTMLNYLKELRDPQSLYKFLTTFDTFIRQEHAQVPDIIEAALAQARARQDAVGAQIVVILDQFLENDS